MKRPPAIIVIGYNRPQSLERLLVSLASADYERENITLVISIDHCEDEQLSRAVIKVADEYYWPHGSKSVTVSDVNLGLRNHVLACGDLSQKYGAIIVLEDDLYVAKSFYSFTLRAVEYFKDDGRIAGVSLYGRSRNQFSQKPFYPVIDGYDNYFLQLTSSWGQIWTADQWGGFRNWYNKNNRVTDKDSLPEQILNWPDTSWAKYYNKYLVVKNKTFVYPRTSFTTNFAEKGVHYPKKTNIEQVSLVLDKSEYAFGSLDKSLAVYDVFFEITPKVLMEKFGVLGEYDFEVDLLGLKDKKKIRKDYILTSRSNCLGIKSYGGDMVPSELNMIFDIKGEAFTLVKVENMNDIMGSEKFMAQDPYELFTNTYSGKVAVCFTIKKLREVFLSRIRERISDR